MRLSGVRCKPCGRGRVPGYGIVHRWVKNVQGYCVFWCVHLYCTFQRGREREMKSRKEWTGILVKACVVFISPTPTTPPHTHTHTALQNLLYIFQLSIIVLGISCVVYRPHTQPPLWIKPLRDIWFYLVPVRSVPIIYLSSCPGIQVKVQINDTILRLWRSGRNKNLRQKIPKEKKNGDERNKSLCWSRAQLHLTPREILPPWTQPLFTCFGLVVQDSLFLRWSNSLYFRLVCWKYLAL